MLAVVDARRRGTVCPHKPLAAFGDTEGLEHDHNDYRAVWRSQPFADRAGSATEGLASLSAVGGMRTERPRRATSSRRRGHRTTTGNGSARNSTTRPRRFLRPSTCGSALRVCMSRRAGGRRPATRPARHSSRTPWISRTCDRVPARIHRATARCLFDLGGVVGAQGFAVPAFFRRGRLILFRKILELRREIDGLGGGRRP